jgi:hypothetical protein
MSTGSWEEADLLGVGVFRGYVQRACCSVRAAALASRGLNLQSTNYRSNNIQTIMVARVLGGAFASTGAILVGGTIADIWEPQEYVIAFFCSLALTLRFIF